MLVQFVDDFLRGHPGAATHSSTSIVKLRLV
jgi:hypothetical protein